MVQRLLLLLACLSCAGVASAQLPVVPGAPSSYGMNTRAAYACGSNPTIYKVTSLADSGTGTLRAALEATVPRVVIFEISGYISITSNINLTSPCITIATQTAPSPGITVRSAGSIPSETGILLNTHDVLWQHMAIRPGSGTCNSGLQVYGGDQYNIVFDHMSFSWGQDENLAFNWTNGQSTQATVWRSIMAEGLLRAPGSNSCTGGGFSNGHGILIDTDARHVAVIQSLFASNFERNPYMLGRTQTALVNNLVYQWHGPWGFFYNNGSVCGIGCGTNDPWYSTTIGNRFIKGPNNCCTGGGDDATTTMFVLQNNGADAPNVAGNAIYRSDNTIANPDATVLTYSNGYSYDPTVSSPPSQAPLPTGLVPMASTAVEAFVTQNAGARPAERDAVDTRIVAYVLARGGNFISQESEVGGYPSLAVNNRTLTPPANPHTVQASGYTALEEWLQGYARIVEGSGAGTPPLGRPNPPTTVHVAAAFKDATHVTSAIDIAPGTSIQSVVDAHPAGTSYRLLTGTHRNQTVSPHAGDSFTGQDGAVMNGSNILTSPTAAGGIWYYTGQTQGADIGRSDFCPNSSYLRCNYPEDVFIDGVPLRHVTVWTDPGTPSSKGDDTTNTAGAIALVTTGTWFFDYAADRIYIGTDPTGHVVETSVTAQAFLPTGTNVTIANLTVTQYASLAQVGTIDCGSGCHISDNTISYNHGMGLRPNTNAIVSGNYIHHNGQLGIGGGGVWSDVAANKRIGYDLIIDNNEISYNNWARYDAGWEAGGTKFVNTDRITVSHNNAHDNIGPGLWSDIDNAHITYAYNTVTHNSSSGIFHEIGWDCFIHHNTISDNGWEFSDYIYGAAILISESQNCEVYANTITSARDGIVGLFNTRGGILLADGGRGLWELKNLNVHDNDTTLISSADTLAGVVTSGHPEVFTSNNVVFTHNTYRLPLPGTQAWFAWDGSARNYTSWKSYGHDATGVMTTY